MGLLSKRETGISPTLTDMVWWRGSCIEFARRHRLGASPCTQGRSYDSAPARPLADFT